MAWVRVESLLAVDGLALELLGGASGLGRRITGARIQKPGLALTGYTPHVHPDRVQVLGLTEMSYLASIDEEKQRTGLLALHKIGPCVLIVTRGLEVPRIAITLADEFGVPLLRSPLMSSVFISRLTKYLEDCLAPTTSVHGVLVDVFGIGILILGKSGIGKSEAALDLVLRGHRLVADDIVEIRRHEPDAVSGAGAEIIKHHMEIRGLGIINIKDLFGVAAVRDAKKIELVAELVEWDESEEYDRLGVDDLTHMLLGVPIPMLRVPIRPGRNITSILEVAARNQLLKYRGIHSARQFLDRLNRAISDARPGAVARADEVE